MGNRNYRFNLKKSHKVSLLVLIFSILWISSGIFFKPTHSNEPPQEDSAKLYRVKVADLYATDVNAEIILKGKTKAARKVVIKAETSGSISEIIKKEGEKISAGSTILRIATDDRHSKSLEAKALVEQRDLEYTAAKNLSQKGFNSQIRLAEAETQLNSAKARLASVELDLKKTTITAPFDGYLDKRFVEIGDFVNIGTPIATIVDLDPITISAEISETNITSVIEGLSAFATLIDGTKLDGEITFVSKIANETTRTYTIEMSSPNSDGFVSEGMTAEVRLSLSPVKAYKISPAILGLNDKGEIGIKTVNEDDVVEFHNINIVKHENDGMWVAGLPNNIRLITAGGDFVKENTKVIAINETIAEQ